MNELQKNILNIMQADFPIVQRPFAEMATVVACDEQDVLEQVAELKQRAIIRRIGAIFDAAHMGYSSTLVAAKVPEEKVLLFVEAVNKLPGVSHNYGRAHRFNVWFTLTVPDTKCIEPILGQLSREFGLTDIYSLPAERLFKIYVNFDLHENGADEKPKSEKPPLPHASVAGETISFSPQQIELIRQLQKDLPVVSEPFDWIADQIAMDADAILAQIHEWKETGVIRRFGASLRHQKVGFAVNGMVVFEVPDQRIELAGSQLAGFQQVSHCYQRPDAKGWPYNLFAMTHCRSKEELDHVVEQMVEKVRPIQYAILQTTAEYKKTNVTYFMD